MTTCQQVGNKQCEHILLTSCWNGIVTSLLQVCYNLCVFTCVTGKFTWYKIHFVFIRETNQPGEIPVKPRRAHIIRMGIFCRFWRIIVLNDIEVVIVQLKTPCLHNFVLSRRGTVLDRIKTAIYEYTEIIHPIQARP